MSESKTASPMAKLLLMKQLKELSSDPPEGVEVWLEDDADLFKWSCSIIGPPGTPYEGGIFTCLLEFPPDFPNMPPKMIFQTNIWHPNIYSDGRVCISILHPPGTDSHNPEELAEERWRPILGVEAILVSVISMLADPNDNSPANIDAAVQWRKDRAGYNKEVKKCVEKSLC
eukprot:GSMAST32.ASY1.ANO1.712.1 assembled CDS